jgi:hypothetical protein
MFVFFFLLRPYHCIRLSASKVAGSSEDALRNQSTSDFESVCSCSLVRVLDVLYPPSLRHVMLRGLIIFRHP